jgi:hypothetical protein
MAIGGMKLQTIPSKWREAGTPQEGAGIRREEISSFFALVDQAREHRFETGDGWFRLETHARSTEIGVVLRETEIGRVSCRATSGKLREASEIISDIERVLGRGKKAYTSFTKRRDRAETFALWWRLWDGHTSMDPTIGPLSGQPGVDHWRAIVRNAIPNLSDDYDGTHVYPGSGAFHIIPWFFKDVMLDVPLHLVAGSVQGIRNMVLPRAPRFER